MSAFLRFRVDLDVKDVWGGSPLRATAQPNNVDFAELLLAAGADVNNHVGEANSTSIAEQAGHTVLMKAPRWYPLRWDPTLIKSSGRQFPRSACGCWQVGRDSGKGEDGLISTAATS